MKNFNSLGHLFLIQEDERTKRVILKSSLVLTKAMYNTAQSMVYPMAEGHASIN